MLVADSSIVSSSRYAATEPCACCARRPASKRMVRLPNFPLSRTASADLISGPSKRCLLFCSRRHSDALREQSEIGGGGGGEPLCRAPPGGTGEGRPPVISRKERGAPGPQGTPNHHPPPRLLPCSPPAR